MDYASERDMVGRELLGQLEKGYDVTRISNWANKTHLDLCTDSDELEDILMTLMALSDGPEFELTESEVRKIAEGLVEPRRIYVKVGKELKDIVARDFDIENVIRWARDVYIDLEQCSQLNNELESVLFRLMDDSKSALSKSDIETMANNLMKKKF